MQSCLTDRGHAYSAVRLSDLTYTAGFAGGSRVKVRLKTWEQMDADFAAAEALASGKPGNIGDYFTVNR